MNAMQRLEDQARSAAAAQGHNAARGHAEANIAGRSIICDVQSYYNSGAQAIRHRVFWKLDGQRVSAAQLQAEAARLEASEQAAANVGL